MMVSLGALIMIGFSVGIVAGILWEEPQLVFAHLTGETAEIAWAETPEVADTPVVAKNEPARTPSTSESVKAIAKPAAARPPEPPPVAAAPPGRVAIQVGAFADNKAAEQLASSLRGRGYSAYVTPGARSAKSRWRVRVGPFADREAAEKMAAKLKLDEKLPTWVLNEDSG
jgi:DedD protein